jgi:hypothetical protein
MVLNRSKFLVWIILDEYSWNRSSLERSPAWEPIAVLSYFFHTDLKKSSNKLIQISVHLLKGSIILNEGKLLFGDRNGHLD